MNDSYYPKHSREHLAVIRDNPIPAQDVPRLTREVEGLQDRVRHLEHMWMTEVSKVAHLRQVVREMMEASLTGNLTAIAHSIELGEQTLRYLEKP